ncbi:MAG: hypothetical protein EZS28_023327 [Streblomastix strix]|uniref:Uncharacterized protein n=1 Tax=Streblomastix strix TaxID=222440 RepID=A0A5J4VF90_9EUKA|nr:MAG: hypothetical protein EZS28_023327 [Streblomastix strix]
MLDLIDLNCQMVNVTFCDPAQLISSDALLLSSIMRENVQSASNDDISALEIIPYDEDKEIDFVPHELDQFEEEMDNFDP